VIPLRDSVRTRTWPVVNVVLIAANLTVFFHELSFGRPALLEEFVLAWGLVPARFLADPWLEWPTLFSSMFLHGGWSHVLGNMLYLWIFGDNVEDRLGHGRYLLFYLLSGVAAALIQVRFFPHSAVPMVGASGAIAGVLGAYFVLYPNARVLAVVPIWVFLKVVEVPALFFLGFWFVLQAFQGMGSILAAGEGGGVAWWAHAGGFAAGIVLVFLFKKRRR
jgi:membrane associated rhomboid family serine protease